MADQPLAPDEPFDVSGAVETVLGAITPLYANAILTAPEAVTGGGGSGGTTAHGFVA